MSLHICKAFKEVLYYTLVSSQFICRNVSQAEGFMDRPLSFSILRANKLRRI